MQGSTELTFPLWGVWHNTIPTANTDQKRDRSDNAAAETRQTETTDSGRRRNWSGLYRIIDLAG